MGLISILAAGGCPDSPMIVRKTSHDDYINYSVCVGEEWTPSGGKKGVRNVETTCVHGCINMQN